MITVNDKMQSGYCYRLDAEAGEAFDAEFKPVFTPKEIIRMGVFEGKYLNDCRDEFPDDWFETAKIAEKADVNLNYFAVKSRQPLAVWREKGWIYGPDPRGWFQWYCAPGLRDA